MAESSPHILIYAPHQQFAAKLAETLAKHAFAVTIAIDTNGLQVALRHRSFSAIVAGTSDISNVRKLAALPIINYEIFVHKRSVPAGREPGNPSVFHVEDFIGRVRFHTIEFSRA